MNLKEKRKKIRGCYKKRKKKNITPENIGEIILVKYKLVHHQR